MSGLLVCLAACSSGPRPWRPLWRAPYGYLPIPDRLEFDRVRKEVERGELEDAWQRLTVLTQAWPDELDLAFAMQDLEVAMWAAGLCEPLLLADDVPAPISGAGALAQSEKAWRARLKGNESVRSYILAARATANAEQAVEWLNQALILEPDNAWAWYGKAHRLLGLRDQYRWRNAREALDRAIALDPSHLLARRLEAWMLAQEGIGDSAADALERWLAASEFDPRATRQSRVEARLDLARVLLALGEADAAWRELSSLEGEMIGRRRRLMLAVVASTERGDVEAALDAVRRADWIAGDGVLPAVQEALLREHWLADPQGALDLWSEVLTEAEGGSDPALLLQALRARVILERGNAPAEPVGEVLP
ncbi:MAG: hypothetical protein R3E96_03040 [Planctomycetota bacterium]